MASTAAMSDNRFRVTRIQRSVVSRRERQILTWLCVRLPAGLTPDHLTLIGVFGAFVILGGYIASRWNPIFLWLASLGFVIHWFGDSLDGSLARYRQIERPIYGYFLDHTVDGISNLIIMLGVGSSLNVRMDVALFALIGYYLLCIYVFINNHLSGILQLSFLGAGPTELRLGLIGINTLMYFLGPVGTKIDGTFFTLYDAMLFFMGATFVIIFLTRMLTGIRDLRDPTRGAVGVAPVQSGSMKASRSRK